MQREGLRQNESRRWTPWLLGGVMLALLAVFVATSLGTGAVRFTVPEIFDILSAKLSGNPGGLAANRVMILWDVRLPRIVTAAVAGAALGLSGAVYQGLLLNPLADPYTLGVSSGSAFGATLVIIAGMFLPEWAFLGKPWMLTVGAFAMACLTLALVVALARDADGHLSPTSLILAGVVLSAILSAALSFFKYLAGDQVGSIVFWLLGSFQARTWTDAAVVTAFFLPTLMASMWSAVDLREPLGTPVFK